jgi:DNA (cytosine-5)-methyltransferase 1
VNVISLFAGIGGFDLGFERAGMSSVAQVENNAAANAVLQRHFPNVQRFEDVRHVGQHNLPAADLVCGGFPCQDLSVAGHRAGLAGERSGLWFEFLRILTEVKPRWCVIENVPGLLSSNGGRDFAVLIHGLVECGYRVCWRVLDAQYFGVPQRRRRVFIVGHLGDGRAAQVLLEQQGGEGHFEPRQQAGQSTAAAARNGAASGSYARQRSDEYADASVDATLASRDYKSATDLVTAPLSASGAGTARTGNERNEAEMLVVAEAIDVRNSRSNGGISGTLQSKANGGYSLNYQNPIAFNWNAGDKASLSLGNTSGTLRTGHHYHPAVQSERTGVRRLTPLECERLQGFPDGWTEGLSDSQRYARLGNAVAVPVIEWIGRRIMALEAEAALTPERKAHIWRGIESQLDAEGWEQE